MSKYLSLKFSQENKERLQNRFVKNIKIFLKNKKKKRDKMFLKIAKVFQKMKMKQIN